MCITSLVLCLPFWDSGFRVSELKLTEGSIATKAFITLWIPECVCPLGIDCSFEMIRSYTIVIPMAPPE